MNSRSDTDPALRTAAQAVVQHFDGEDCNGECEFVDALRAALAAAEAAPLDDCDERMKAYRARRENLARRKYDEGREQGQRDAAEAAPLAALAATSREGG